MAEYLQIDSLPDLRDPVLLAAFEGWNDASNVATGALRHLVRRWSGTRIASIDPEEFYVFTDTRPHVRYDEQGQRSVTWPENVFWACRDVHRDRDAVVLVGVEPQLRWRAFTDQILDFADRLGVKHVVSLGGLIADVAHTQPPDISGSASLTEMREKLQGLGIGGTRYEGPTGIVGVLQDAARRRGFASASIWGSVPVYLRETIPNPPVQTALLKAVSGLLDLGLDLRTQEQEASRFVRTVDEAVAGNATLLSHIRGLEQRRGVRREERRPEESPQLPSGADLVRDLEEFLRQQSRRPNEEEQSQE